MSPPDADGPGSKRRLLGELGDRVAPVVMAHERMLPVPEPLADLFPGGGMVRGRAVSCAGPAATSLALSLVAPSIAAGSWMAVIDLPTLGLDAASESGVPLERVVGVELGERSEQLWADVVAAAADGFEVVLTRVPAAIRPTTARAVATRLQQRGAVVVVVGDTRVFRCDVTLDSSELAWEGIGDGFGHLRARTVRVDAGGRRVPGARRCRLTLPAGDGVVRLSEPTADVGDTEEDHGAAFVLAG